MKKNEIKGYNTIKQILLFLLFVILLIYITYCAKVLFQPKESYYKYKDFFREKEEYDVLFFGSSHTENFFNPMVLWKKYGITSYNFGNSEEPISVTYWTIRNAIHIKKPKVIVVDLFMYNRELESREYFNEKVHYSLDYFPMTREKISAIYNLSNNKEEFVDKIFTLSTYHSRWKNLNDDRMAIDYFVNGFLSYGHPVTMGVESFEANEITDKKSNEINQEDIDYINKIIELCNEESISLIFTSTPYVCSPSEQMDINYLSDVISESGVQFVNYNKKNDVIDYDVDLYNIGHVNATGAKKVTESIGSILSEKYLDSISHDESTTNCWDEKYKKYIQLKLESVWAVDELDSTLMLMNDEDLNSYLFCQPGITIESDRTKKLIDNICSTKSNHIFNIDSEYFDELTREIDYDNEADVYVLVCDANEVIILKSFRMIDDKFVGKTEYVKFESEYLFND